MATVTRENLGTLHDKITVKISKEDYMLSFEKSLKQYAKQANVPGFRKGMVPPAMVRKMYGPSIFGDEVIRTAGRQLEDYLKAENLQIFAQPMIIPNPTMKADMNNAADMDFEFEIGIKPEFEIPALKNKTAITKYQVAISDKMLDDEIERTRRRFGKVEELTKVSANDEIAYLNLQACDADGNANDAAEKVEHSGLIENYPEAFQKLLLGKTTNDSAVFVPAEMASGDALAAFMKNVLKADSAQANSHFKLTLTKIGTIIPHDLNAELYMQVFQNQIINSPEEFKEKMRNELSKEFNNASQRRMNDEIFELLVHSTPIELPVNFLKRWMKDGQEKPKTEAEVEREFPSMEHQLRWELISSKIMEENKIQVTYEEVMEEIKKSVLGYFGLESEEDAPWLQSYLQKMAKEDKTIDQTYRNMLINRLFDELAKQFDVTVQEVDEETFFKLPNAHDAHHHH